MRDLSNRLDRLTQELRALRLQLQWSTFRGSNPADQNHFLNHVLDAGLVEDLKKVIDDLSHFLWCYIDTAAQNSGPDVDFELQSKRLGQVTEMLRLLRQSSCPATDQLEFVARVTLAVDRHLEAHKKEEIALERSA